MVLGICTPEPIVEVSWIGQRVVCLVPERRQCQHVHGPQRQVFLLGDHSEEAAVAQDLQHAWHILDLASSYRPKARAIVRWPHDPGMHHSRQTKILHIGEAASYLGGNIDALYRLSDH